MSKFFKEDDVRELVWESEVERIVGESRRWSRTNLSIVESEGKFYELQWEQGLTEQQEDEYFDQTAKEVEQIEKTVVVKEWREINGKI